MSGVHRTCLARLTAATILSLLCAVSLAAPPPWESRDVPHGSIEQVWYAAPTMELKQRRMYVYLPSGYHNNVSRKYAVLYLLHGGGGDEEQWVTLGHAAIILDNEIADGTAMPMIVVMPNGNDGQATPPDPGRYALHEPQHPEPYEGVFAESLVKDVVPFIERTYRVHASRHHRAIAGLSMGGAQTAVITAHNPGMFDYIGVFSAGGMVGDPKFDAQLEALAKAKAKLYWTGAGDDDISRLRATKLYEGAKAKGLPATYTQIPGTHSWPLWREFLVDFSGRLFK